jgi:hypothetical protein
MLIEILAHHPQMEFMRSPVSILSALITASFLLCASIAATLGDDGSTTDIQQDPRREWHALAKGRKEFEVSDPALLPARLALAAEQTSCGYKDEIKSEPVRFITVDRHRLAIIFCRSGIVGSQRVFDLTDLKRPRQMEFPVPLLHSNGFGTKSQPGMITWKKEAGVFETQAGSDMICTGQARYTYRLDDTGPSLSFAIIRAEIKKDECRQSEWTTIWEAPTWSELFR